MPAQRDLRRRTSAGPRAGAGLVGEQRRCMTTTGDCPKRDEKMNPVLYFAYGSNLDDAQMRERCANARVVGRATLPNYALVFGGFSHRWGGAVASVVRAKGACVEGLLYELGNVDLRELDRFEGHPFAYERVIRWVRDESGGRRRVMTYLQPEDGFEAWAPPLGYFTVLWHAYARLGFDVEPLARAAGVSP